MTVFLKSWIFSTGAASRVLPLHIVHIPFLHSMVRVCLTNAKNSFQISVYNKLSTRDLSLIRKTGSKAEDAKRSSLLVTRRGSIRKKCIRNKSITGRAQFESFGDKVRETRLKCVDMCRCSGYTAMREEKMNTTKTFQLSMQRVGVTEEEDGGRCPAVATSKWSGQKKKKLPI